jgi:hypothetical protein
MDAYLGGAIAVTVNGELDLFSHTINPLLGLVVLLLPLSKWHRTRIHKTRYYGALVSVVLLAYAWMYFERKYQWWEHVWGVTFSTHTAVHVAILSCLWQWGSRWRVASILIGISYALLMVYRHYHAPSDIALTTAAMLPELIVVWWLAQARRDPDLSPSKESLPPVQ